MDQQADELSGRVVAGRYRVLRPLAEGGIGRVYEAEHIELGKRVALKVLATSYARDAETIERFMREARAASSIGHPNIVEVLDLGRAQDGAPFLVMELLAGRDLDALLGQEKRLSPERVVSLLAPIASALDAVHARGIVHRDIKPANVFLARQHDGSERPKLLDFGLAAFHESGERLTQVGSIVGTPHYMSPEAAQGELGGPRADVYSLACVAYECLCGLLPFDAEIARGVLTKKVTRVAPSMAERSGLSFPAAAEALLARALDRDIEARPVSCGELISELSAAFAPVPLVQRKPPAPAPRRLSLDAREAQPTTKETRSRTPYLLAALAVVPLAGGAIWWAMHPAPSPPIVREPLRPIAPAPREVEPSPAPPVVAPVPEPPVATEPVVRERTPRRRIDAGTRGRIAPVAVVEARPDAVPPHAPAGVEVERPSAPPNPELAAQRAADLSRQGASALLNGEVARALALYREATQSDDRYAPGWRGLGLAQERLQHVPEAIRAYRRFLALSPPASEASAVRARLARLEAAPE